MARRSRHHIRSRALKASCVARRAADWRLGGNTYDFVSWSDGGQATHEIATPTEDTTYTALYQPTAAAAVFNDNFETSRLELHRDRTPRRQDAGSAAIRKPQA